MLVSPNGRKVVFQRTPHIVGPTGAPFTVYTHSYDGLEYSENHHLKPDGSWSGGGPFYVYKKGTSGQFYYVDWKVLGTIQRGYIGSPSLPSLAPTSPSVPLFATYMPSLQADYATGFARTRPGNPLAAAGQFGAELHQIPRIPLLASAGTIAGLGTLIRRLHNRLFFFRSLGNEYLNITFGWAPFVRDLQQMYHLQKNMDTQIAQIIRDNGRGIRRRCTLENDSSVSQTKSTNTSPFGFCTGGVTFFGGCTSTLTTTTTVRTHRWYVGKYQYYIPDLGSSEWTARARRALFGINPTPSLLWELLPWSWLVDWFTNAGDVFSNASSNAVDNLTCKYSYIMKNVRTEVQRSAYCEWPTRESGGVNPTHAPGGRTTLTTTEYVESKVRAGSLNPFGLGIQFSSLTNYQIGILAALGLSRGLVK